MKRHPIGLETVYGGLVIRAVLGKGVWVAYIRLEWDLEGGFSKYSNRPLQLLKLAWKTFKPG